MRTHLHDTTNSSGVNGTYTTPGKVVDSIFYSSDPAHSARSPLSFSNLLPSFLPTSGAGGALVGALLLALTCEHIYALLRAGVRHTLERTLWRGSEEETTLRRREWEQRQEALNHSGLAKDLSSFHHNEKIFKQNDLNDPFWASSNGGDVGLSVIQGTSKTE